MPKEKSKPENQGSIKARIYRGMPDVDIQLPTEDSIEVEVKLTGELADRVKEAAKDTPIKISLQSLDIDLQHNQSYGMVSASTGCISNPGGPSC